MGRVLELRRLELGCVGTASDGWCLPVCTQLEAWSCLIVASWYHWTHVAHLCCQGTRSCMCVSAQAASAGRWSGVFSSRVTAGFLQGAGRLAGMCYKH